MLQQLLEKHQKKYTPIFKCEFNEKTVMQLDLSVDNRELYDIDLLKIDKLQAYIQHKLSESGKLVAIGGYNEDRLIYQKSKLFGEGDSARTIHLGIDIWCNKNTDIYAFMDSKIHSFKHNDNFGDYGPTIILEHKLDDVIFYSLYGHLSLESLSGLKPGQFIRKGERFAALGNETENGNWPPHLHFQLMSDMLGNKGDFPGVCSKAEKAKWLNICPNPQVLLIY